METQMMTGRMMEKNMMKMRRVKKRRNLRMILSSNLLPLLLADFVADNTMTRPALTQRP